MAKKYKKIPPAPPATYPGLASGGMLLLIFCVSLLAYSACFGFTITNWDEKRYLLETPMIRELSWENIRLIFTSKVLNSYNPLVLLSFAADNALHGTEYGWFHGENVVLHGLNSMLVFLCVRKFRISVFYSGIIALLFSVHPMHVESVAWIASRKDVLFTFFFLLSWMMYITYLNKNSITWYLAGILFFALSLLSKAQAVTLPLVLLLTDYLLNGRLNVRNLLDKIPWFLLAAGAGYMAISGSTFVADKYAAPLTLWEKSIYSVIATGMYLAKAVIPFSQSAIYAFIKSGTTAWYTWLIISFVLIATLVFSIIRYGRKNRLIPFGVLFFFVNIFLTLHIVAVNSSLIYERFSYISYLGLFMAGTGMISGMKNSQIAGKAVLVSLTVIFGILTWQRTLVWKNSETLWTDVIKKNPEAQVAYNNRGEYYNNRNELDKAFADFNSSIRVRPRQPSAFNNRSVIYFKRGEMAKALDDNETALSLEPDYPEAIANRGIIYFNMNQFDSAIYYYDKALIKLPNYPSAWLNLGSAWLKKGNPEKAIESYRKALEYLPGYTDAWKYMGIAYVQLDSLAEATTCISEAKKSGAGQEVVRAISNEYLGMGNAAYKNGSTDKAMEYYQKAAGIDPANAEAYYDLGGIYLMKRDIKKAREYWRKTLQLEPGHAAATGWLNKTGGL